MKAVPSSALRWWPAGDSRCRVVARRRLTTFGVPGLRTAADIPVVTRIVLTRCNRLAAAAAAAPEPLAALDALSSTLCNTLDVMECARNVHPDPAFAQAADEAHTKLAGHMAALNTDEQLYAKVLTVLDDPRRVATLSSEWRRFARSMAADFEHGGAHLSSVERGRLRTLQTDEVRRAQAFAAGCGRSGMPTSDGVWVGTSALRGGFGERVLALMQRRRDGMEILVPPEPHVLTAALYQADCERARRQLLKKREMLSGANCGALDELLRTRHAIAGALGHRSHAVCAFSHGRIERAPGAVGRSLVRLSERAAPRARAELNALGATKRRLAGRRGGCVLSDAVMPWDLDFLMEARRAELYGTSDGELSEYLEVESSLNGVRMVLASAFGLTLQPAIAAVGELWHPSVRKYLLTYLSSEDGAQQPIGLLYLDLFARKSKSSHPAVYTLRAAGMTTAGPKDGHLTDELLMRHLPAAALVMDLPTALGPGADDCTGLALLSPKQLEVLYHEIGHAIHALISRTETHHFSGLRTSLDFVEVPSLLMERFASEPGVLARWARHHKTGAPLPRPLAVLFGASDKLFLGIETQTQCLRALIDLRLHCAPRHGVEETTRLVSELTAAHTVLPTEMMGSPHLWHGSYRHLAHYATGCYTYLWARSLSERVWRHTFEHAPLNAAGFRWHDAVLRHGGSRDPVRQLRASFESRT